MEHAVENKEAYDKFTTKFIAYGKTPYNAAIYTYNEIIALLNFNILNLKAEQIKLGQKTVSCNKKLEDTRLNFGLPLEENSNYVINLINAKNNLTQAENDLKVNSDKLKFLEDELSIFDGKLSFFEEK